MAKLTDTRLSALANNTKSSNNKSTGDFATDSKSNKSNSKKSSGIANAVSNLLSSSKSSSSSNNSGQTSSAPSIKFNSQKDEDAFNELANTFKNAYAKSQENKAVVDEDESSSSFWFDSPLDIYAKAAGFGLSDDTDSSSSDSASSYKSGAQQIMETIGYSPTSVLTTTQSDPYLTGLGGDASELTDYQQQFMEDYNSNPSGSDSSSEENSDASDVTTSSDEVSFKDAVQKIMRAYTGNEDWDFYTDYADLAENGDADTWRQIYQSPELMQGYIDQYGLDTDGDGTISDDEANAWYNKMKEENVSDLNFTNDDEITSRIFGNMGEGSNNDIVDALLNSLSAQLIESDNSDDQTYYNLVNLFTPYYEDEEGNVEAGTTDLQRLNNAVKLSYILEAMDNGNNNSIDMGDNDEDVANYMNSLLANINGGDAGNTFSLEDLKGQDAGNGASYYANTSNPASSGAEEFENMINQGSTQASDALLSYLLSATNSRNENNDSLKDAGYYSWLKSALASTEE